MDYTHLPHHHRSSHTYASSTMSAETLSGSCGSRNKRVRTIRLVRRSNGISTTGTLNSSRHTPCMGFSVRGGYEHGTGLFVSHVESGSEAYIQGLKVGDQIIRINGFTIEDAVHKEVIQLLFSHTHLTLKVRDVGMIPVKEKKSDALSWQIIPDTDSSSRSSPQFGEKNRDVRINILVAARSKLGCGICKGPDWKPGIFVQFTKEGGIAREAGLRPGDQILQCNNVDFADIPFNEAVNLMKTSRQLDLMIRKAAATELFPGESSGYNSSASSVTEDQNPAWADPKRLSIVKEENHDLDERISNNKRIFHNKKWTLEDWEEMPSENKYFKPTIINLSENGTTIKNNGNECKKIEKLTNSNVKSVDNFKEKQIQDTQTVVEVHRSDVDDNEQNKLSKSSSVSSFNSLANSTLSSAITMEIQRRVKKQATKESEPSIEEQIQMKKVLKGVNSNQQHQHNQLMSEFIQAHQKMFKSTEAESKQTHVIGQETMDRLVHKDLSQKLSNRLMNLVNNTDHKKEGSKENSRMISLTSPPPPPPPPPSVTGPVLSQPSLPITSTTSGTLKPNKTKPKAPPVPVKHSILSTRQPPPCPTPDYDTLSISSSTSSLKPSRCNLNEAVEMESLDSFNISHPTNIQPKPPNNYFQKRQLTAQTSNSSTSSATIGRPKSTLLNNSGHTLLSERPKSVSVTIGEYAGVRSQPGRLDFLRNEVEKFNGMTDELTQTLNRSNLRKRTESMDNLLGSPQIKPQSNGTVRISLKSNLSKEFTKSTSDLTEDFNRCTFKPGNRVMINVNQENIYGSIGGILKNS